MSLATDLLMKHFNSTPSKSHRVRHKGKATYLELAARRMRANGNTPGVYIDNVNHTYRARVIINGVKHNLGSFTHRQRAYMAVRLFTFWQNRGYEDIPSRPEKRFAYVDYDRNM